ncbi:DNA-directed RNA polymerase subunit alpha [bacterium]|nr:DNA-directed RNA polymerase subunit alpha [bacterium]
MEAFKDIKVTIKEKGENYGLFEISPLPRGYGHTLGNALRRILYSSLKGTGITSVKVKGIDHEFSTIDGVKETLIEIIMNLKEVRFKTSSNEPVIVNLNVKGKKDVTAGDIETSGDLEVVNKDLHILSLADESSSINMELTVESGVGYRSVDNDERSEIGLVPVDCDFSPIQRVSLVIDRARKGQETDLDAVLIGVTTDGSIEPKDALLEAAKILQEFSGKVMVAMGMAQEEVDALETEANKIDEPVKEEEETEDNKIANWKIEDLPISKRSKTGLLSGGYKTVADFKDTTTSDLLNLPGFGVKSLNEIVELLREYGINIKN